MKRTWLGVAFVAGGALAVSGCGAATVREEPARVQFLVEPADARVYVDDRLVGTARVLRVTHVVLKPGLRLVTVEARDHFPHDFELQAVPGVTTARVRLRPIPE